MATFIGTLALCLAVLAGCATGPAPASAGYGYYSQPGALFRLMNAKQKKTLFENTARAMGDAPEAIKRRHIEHCTKADKAYGEGVVNAIETLASSKAKPKAPPTAKQNPR